MELKCTKCGKIVGCSKGRWEKNLAKFGSEEELRNSYVCRDCRKTIIKITDADLPPSAGIEEEPAKEDVGTETEYEVSQADLDQIRKLVRE